MRKLATFLAGIPGAAVALAAAHFLAVDICLDGGGRIADWRLTCEVAHGALVVVRDYFGVGPLLLALASGILTTGLVRRLFVRRLP